MLKRLTCDLILNKPIALASSCIIRFKREIGMKNLRFLKEKMSKKNLLKDPHSFVTIARFMATTLINARNFMGIEKVRSPTLKRKISSVGKILGILNFKKIGSI